MKGDYLMEVELIINNSEERERIVIYAREITKELQGIMDCIDETLYKTIIYGQINEELYPLNNEEIVRFYTENRAIFAEDSNRKYKVNKRLYELEQILPKQFVRISQSEIININFIKKLKQEINGLIKISFKNGEVTYSSRRYLKSIRGALQL